MADIDETFDKVESGASMTYPMQVGSLKKGGYAILSGKPCKVNSFPNQLTRHIIIE